MTSKTYSPRSDLRDHIASRHAKSKLVLRAKHLTRLGFRRKTLASAKGYGFLYVQQRENISTVTNGIFPDDLYWTNGIFPDDLY